MTPYNHLRSQHCNASWRGQFMYIAQLAPHTTFNTEWVWLREGSRPSRVETFPRSHPETTFQVYKHFDHTENRIPVAWTQIQSANLYTTDPRSRRYHPMPHLSFAKKHCTWAGSSSGRYSGPRWACPIVPCLSVVQHRLLHRVQRQY